MRCCSFLYFICVKDDECNNNYQKNLIRLPIQVHSSINTPLLCNFRTRIRTHRSLATKHTRIFFFLFFRYTHTTKSHIYIWSLTDRHVLYTRWGFCTVHIRVTQSGGKIKENERKKKHPRRIEIQMCTKSRNARNRCISIFATHCIHSIHLGMWHIESIFCMIDTQKRSHVDP